MKERTAARKDLVLFLRAVPCEPLPGPLLLLRFFVTSGRFLVLFVF